MAVTCRAAVHHKAQVAQTEVQKPWPRLRRLRTRLRRLRDVGNAAQTWTWTCPLGARLSRPRIEVQAAQIKVQEAKEKALQAQDMD